VSGEIRNTEERYKTLVQHVLNYHNDEYRTDMVIMGSCEDIYPELKGETNWDWVCRDKTNGNEAAAEVKRLTNQELEKRKSILYKIGRELSNELSNKLSDKLPGMFVLHMGIPEESIQLHRANKEQLKSILTELICEVAQRLEVKGEEDLTQRIKDKLPYQLPEECTFNINKYNAGKSSLGINPHYTRFCPVGRLEGREFDKFKKLIQGANEQLASATRRGILETILIIIEQGFSFAEADVIQETLKVLDPSDYSHIKRVYRVSGDEVQEILLPSAQRDSETSKHAPHLSRIVMEFTLPSEPPDTD